MEKIAVIGSHSFLGSHFVHQALSRGFDVLGLSYASKTSIPFTPYHWKVGSSPHLSLSKIAPNKPYNKALAFINDYQPHYIIHCADDAPFEIYDQLNNKPKKYVYISTSKKIPFDQSKTSELSPIVITPTAHIYGPGQQVHHLIPKIILSILLEKKIPLNGEGDAIRSLIHIDDMIAAIFQTAFEGIPGERYHFSTNHSISIHNLVALICKRMNTTFENVVTIAEDDNDKEPVCYLEHLNNYQPLVWPPTIELERGIDSVIAWAQEWLPALKNHPLDLKNSI